MIENPLVALRALMDIFHKVVPISVDGFTHHWPEGVNEESDLAEITRLLEKWETATHVVIVNGDDGEIGSVLIHPMYCDPGCAAQAWVNQNYDLLVKGEHHIRWLDGVWVMVDG